METKKQDREDQRDIAFAGALLVAMLERIALSLESIAYSLESGGPDYVVPRDATRDAVDHVKAETTKRKEKKAKTLMEIFAEEEAHAVERKVKP